MTDRPVYRDAIASKKGKFSKGEQLRLKDSTITDNLLIERTENERTNQILRVIYIWSGHYIMFMNN